MPYTLEFDSSKQVFTFGISGKLSNAIFGVILLKLVSSKEYPADVDTIWDLREMDFSNFAPTIVGDIAEMRGRFSERGQARIAFVISSEFNDGPVRILEQLVQRFTNEYRIFADITKAEQWLRPEGKSVSDS